MNERDAFAQWQREYKEQSINVRLNLRIRIIALAFNFGRAVRRDLDRLRRVVAR
jgi:hypothetical protein